MGNLTPLPFNTIYQLLADTDEPLLAHAHRALLIPDLLAFWLTGAQRCEVTNASTTGLLDPTTRHWAPDLLALIPHHGPLFADLIEPGEVIGQVLPTTGTPTGIAGVDVIAVGSHDTASAVVGVPATTPNFAYIACGTWGLVGVELTTPVLTDASRRANFTNELGVDNTVRYLRNVMGLWVLQQCHAEWQRAGDPTDIAGLVAKAAATPTGGPVIDIDDPTLLAPGDMVFRIQQLCRSTDQPTPKSVGEIARCVIDSLAAAFARTITDAAQLSGKHIEIVHLVGGGAQNTLLCQLTANASGLPVIAGPIEATTLGNVIIQARAHGTINGDLPELRGLLARTQRLIRYDPTR